MMEPAHSLPLSLSFIPVSYIRKFYDPVGLPSLSNTGFIKTP